MNKATAARYERIGALLEVLHMQTKVSVAESLMIAELMASDRPFQTAVELISHLSQSPDLLTLTQIAESLGVSNETAKVVVRHLKIGGFEFQEKTESLPSGGYVSLHGLAIQESALSYVAAVSAPKKGRRKA